MADTDRPIRIMRIAGRMNISGPARHAILLTARMGSPEYESMLVAAPSDVDTDTVEDFARANAVEPVLIPELGPVRGIFAAIRAVRQLRQLMLDYQPDVVHAHTMKPGILGRVAARLAGVPVIVYTFHEYPFHGYFNQIRTQRVIWAERFVARFSDSIITLTESLRTDLAERYNITRRSHVTVLPLGLDLDIFAQVQRHHGRFREQWNIPENAPLVGIIGRLMPVKNHALFLDAAARVREVLPDARFVVVGDGWLRDELEAQAQSLGLDDATIFTGWQHNVADIYGDLDVNVISSLNEGTPVPVIEALAAGCPVVATGVGGIPDLLDQGELGRLVPPDNVEALANAIIETLQNPPDVERAQQAMLDRYSIDRLIDDLGSLYRGLLLAKRRK